jgi:hypothetical protein
VSRIFVVLGRLAIMLAGYAAASLAASAFLNMVFLASAGLLPEDAAYVASGSAWITIPFVALFVAYFSAVPALVPVLLAELLGARDWLYHAIAGGVVGLLVAGLFWQSAEPGHPLLADPRAAMVVIGAGLVGGLAYWAIAGRTAGFWRTPRQPGPPHP